MLRRFSRLPPLGSLASSTHRRFSSAPARKHYDVVVSGGGVVGLTFLNNFLRLLGDSSDKVKVAFIDNRPNSFVNAEDITKILTQPKHDIRVYALSPASISLLTSIGAWKYINDASRFQPYHKMQIWDEAGPGLLQFDAADSDLEQLGCIVEDATIQAALHQVLLDKGFEIDRYDGCAITELDYGDEQKHLYTPLTLSVSNKNEDSSISLQTRLLVGADGPMSPVRKLANMTTWGWNYGQEAVVATVETETFHTVAWQKYLSTGPLAVLPLWDMPIGDNDSNGEKDKRHYSSIVWSVPTSEAKRLKSLSNEDFVDELNETLHRPSNTSAFSIFEPEDGSSDNLSQVMNTVKKEVASVADMVMSASQLSGSPSMRPPYVASVASTRVSFPLQFQQASTYVSDRVALAGDSAHSIHPQAGQGLNLGIGDAKKLSEDLSAAMASGADIGSHQVLREYSKQRYVECLAMMGGVDVINSFFKSSEDTEADGEHKKFKEMNNKSDQAKLLLRSMGMLGLHALPAVKSRIAKFAMMGFK
jgi:ubiquinone biosynthesis monooxygenase Coq6